MKPVKNVDFFKQKSAVSLEPETVETPRKPSKKVRAVPVHISEDVSAKLRSM